MSVAICFHKNFISTDVGSGPLRAERRRREARREKSCNFCLIIIIIVTMITSMILMTPGAVRVGAGKT